MKYPIWKKTAWRFGRTFVSSFVVQLLAFTIIADGVKLLSDGMSVGFSGFLGSILALVFYPVILSGIIAGIAAIGKFLRETFGSDDYGSPINKIIF